MTFPHCDQDILHAPKECHYCDTYASNLQQDRIAKRIAFSGHEPKEGETACPATFRRPYDIAKRWHGNAAQTEQSIKRQDEERRGMFEL